MKMPAKVHHLLTAALASLSNDATTDTLALSLPQIAAKDYAAVDKVLTAIGLTWNRRAQAHTGPAALSARLTAAIQSGTYIDPRSDREFFATPPDLCATLARLLADKLPEDEPVRILEPSAGEGDLIDATLDALPLAQITAVEQDAMAAAMLRAKYQDDPRVTIIKSDFAAFAAAEPFAGIIMNPPFAHARAHLAHAYDLLARDGELVGIMPFEATQPLRPLGRWLTEHDGYAEDLEPGTFKSSGTNVPTALITLTKVRTQAERLRDALGTPPRQHGLIDRLEHLSFEVLHLVAQETCRPLTTPETETLTAHRLEALTIADALRAKLVAHCDPRGGHGLGLKLANGAAHGWGGHLPVPAVPRPKAKPIPIASIVPPSVTDDDVDADDASLPLTPVPLIATPQPLPAPTSAVTPTRVTKPVQLALF